jgi:hypothetical protein
MRLLGVPQREGHGQNVAGQQVRAPASHLHARRACGRRGVNQCDRKERRECYVQCAISMRLQIQNSEVESAVLRNYFK